MTEQIFDSGDKVEYLVKDKWRNGVIHAVRKVDEKKGQRVIAYLVDTGKVERKKSYTGKLDNLPEDIDKRHVIDQPQQVEVLPENIRAVK